MKLKKIRKWCCGFLAVIMFITNVPMGLLDNKNTHSVMADEIKESAGDIEEDYEAPIVSSVKLIENGDTLLEGEIFSIEFSGYDSKGNISLEEGYCHLVSETNNCGKRATSIIYNEEKNTYTMTFELDYNMTSEWYFLEYIRVLDDSGNYCLYKIDGDEQGFYVEEDFTKFNKEWDCLGITDIIFSQSEIVLDEEKSVQNIEIMAEVLGSEKFTEENTYTMWVDYIVDESSTKYKTSKQVAISIEMKYDFEKKLFVGDTDISADFCGGTYYLLDIHASWLDNYDWQIFGRSEEMNIIVDKNFARDYSCIIEDMYFELNGEKINAGFSAQEDDTVEFVVRVSDELELAAYNKVKVYSFDEYSNVEWCEFEKSSAGVYKTTIPVEDMNSTKWYISNVELYDIYGNGPRFSDSYCGIYIQDYVTGVGYFSTRKIGSYSFYRSLYFSLISEEYQEPTLEYKIKLSYLENMYSCADDVRYIETEHISSIRQMFSGEMPSIPEVEGIEFVGWSINGNIIDVDEVVNLDNYLVDTSIGRVIELEAVYDKIPVEIWLHYCGHFIYTVSSDIVLVDSNSTYEDIIDLIENDIENDIDIECEHSDGLQLEGWYYDDNVNINEVIDIENKKIAIYAKYDKIPVEIDYSYIDEENEKREIMGTPFYVEKSTTYRELMEIMKEKEIAHTGDAEFIEWQCEISTDNFEVDYEKKLDEVINSRTYIKCQATYDKVYVRVRNDYVKPDNSRSSDIRVYFLDNNMTYAELVVSELLSVEHTDDAKFIKWDVYGEWNSGWMGTEHLMDEYVLNDGYVERKAQYDMISCDIYCEYIDMTYDTWWGYYVVFVEEEATYSDVVEAMSQIHIDCPEDIRLVGWTLYIDNEVLQESMLDEKYIPQTNIKAIAEYEENSESLYKYSCLDDGTICIEEYKGYDEAEIIIPSEIDNKLVTQIGNRAFSGHDEIITVYIPESVTSINSWAFYENRNLKEINVAENNLIYKSMDGIVFDKSGETLVKYPAGREEVRYVVPEGVMNIAKRAFSQSCISKVELSEDVRNINMQAFAECKNLISISIPEGVETIGDGAFSNCENLEIIEIPSTVKDIGSITFKGCSKLTTVNIPDGVTYLGDSIFCSCISLKEIIIPNSVTEIGAGAFDGCSSIVEIELPNTITNIGYRAFCNCTNLVSINIPENLKAIYSITFLGCDSLKELKIPKTIEEIADKAYGYYWDSDLEAYKAYDDVCIYGYSESAAESYATDNEIDFVNLYDVASEKKEVILEFFESVFDEIISLTIEEFKDGQDKYDSLNLKDKFEEISQDGKTYDFKVYDIKLLNDKGNEIQPNDSLWVKLLCPEGYDPNNCGVYHIDKDGNVSNMNANYDGKYFVFETDHFSVYFITEAKLKETSPYIVGDANGDEKVDSQDAVLLKKYLAGYTDLGISEEACDVNKDGNVNSSDAVILLKYLAGYEGVLQ